MYHPRLRGTHYEMGHHYASLIYRHGFRIGNLPKLSQKNLDFGKQSEKIVKDHFPEILEEVRGFADGCKGSYDSVVSFLLNIGIEEFQAPKCSIFAVKTGSGVFFGRNHDYSPHIKKLAESCLVIPNRGYRFIGQSDVFIGKCDGVNEKGLAIGVSFVEGKTSRPGLNFEMANRYVLEKCAKVREALDALSKMRFSTSQNFLIADKSGDMAVVEACAEKIRVRRPDNSENFIIATNNFLHPEMKEMEQDHDRDWFHSKRRYKTIHDALILHSAEFNLHETQRLLSGGYGFICQYEKSSGIDTIWSFTANIDRSEIMRAEGNPGRTKFKPDARFI